MLVTLLDCQYMTGWAQFCRQPFNKFPRMLNIERYAAAWLSVADTVETPNRQILTLLSLQWTTAFALLASQNVTLPRSLAEPWVVMHWVASLTLESISKPCWVAMCANMRNHMLGDSP